MKNLNQGGFSLLEVLITLVVLAVGLVSLAKFQGTAVESGSHAKASTVGVHLAQEKLDDLRNFLALTETDTTTGAIIACGAAALARFDCIVTNGGGNVLLPTGNITVSDVLYTRTWTVTNFYFPATAALGKTPNVAATTTVPVAPLVVPSYPDFKRVTVTVTWTDQDGIARNVVLTSIISATDPLYSGRILENI